MSYADRLFSHVRSLPCLPPVLVTAMQVIRDPAASAAELAAVIRKDPGLSAEVLRLVNSSFYGFRRRIGTVTEAVTLLGFSPVRHLLVAAAVLDLLDVEESVEFSPARFWEHAVATGLLAAELAGGAGRDQREELFLAGLLHDVGKLIEYQLLRREFMAVLSLARTAEIPICLAEDQLLGVTHEAVGGFLADEWRLPEAVRQAIRHHHAPELAETAAWEAAAVHVADGFAPELAGPRREGAARFATSETVWGMLDLAPEEAQGALDRVAPRFADVVALVAGWWRRFPGVEESVQGGALPGSSRRARP